MSWHDEFKVAAVHLAYGDLKDGPGGEPAPVDPAQVTVTSSYEEGWGYSEYTFESNFLRIEVRYGPRLRTFENEAASGFLTALMTAPVG